MKNWTIGRRMVVGFSAVLLVMVGVGGFAFSRLREIKSDSAKILGDALPGITAIQAMASNARESRALLLEHLLTTDPAAMTAIDRKVADLGTAYDKLVPSYQASITTDRDRQLFDQVLETRKAVLEIRDSEVLPLSRQGKTQEAFQAFETRLAPEFDKYLAAVAAEVALNEENGATFGADLASAVQQSETGILLGVLVAVALGGLVAWVIVGTTNKALRASVAELTEGATQVASASSQVSTAAQSLSQGATEQAASLEETSASMEEMASMTRQNAENSQTAAGLMGEVDARVRESNEALGDMVSSMASIQDSSRQVAKIIKTIDEIAFQTNILALNAAVEAARAGEAGMGFAVVADEVRSLAQRSAQAAKDTANLIEAAIAKSQNGNDRVQQVASSISGITESVGKVKGLVDEVSVASRQQAQGIDQVSQAVAQMEKVTQGTAATAEESAAASEELNAQAEASMSVIVRLEAMVGGGTSRAAAPQGRTAAGGAPKVVRMPAAAAGRGRRTAEEILPLGDTGTFGKF